MAGPDTLKLLAALIGYLVAAPLLGILIAPSRLAQKLVFAGLIFLTGIHPDITTWMLESIEWYRGHTKGYELSLMEIFAIALIVSSLFSKETRHFKILAPGVIFYLLYCALAMVSTVTAYNDEYVFMAAFKFTKAIVIFIAAYNFLQKRSDIDWVMAAFAVTLILQCVIAMKLRFIDGHYRVHGWFEHQNSLAYWAYMVSIPLLAVALHRKTNWPRTFLYAAAVMAGGVIVVLTVTRASIAAFAAAAAIVVVLTFFNGITLKRSVVALGGVAAACVVFAFSADTLLERFVGVKDYDRTSSFRYLLDRMSAAMVEDYPLGVGWNNYGIANSQPIPDYSYFLEEAARQSRGVEKINLETFTTNPLTENLYYLNWAETGYQGLIAYAAFLVLTLWWCFRNARFHFDHPLGYFLLGLGIVLIFGYLHGFIERILTQTKNMTTWFILIGLVAKVEVWRRVSDRAAKTFNPWLAGFFRALLQSLAPTGTPAKASARRTT